MVSFSQCKCLMPSAIYLAPDAHTDHACGILMACVDVLYLTTLNVIMRRIQLTITAALALLALGCSKSSEVSLDPGPLAPQMAVVHLSGTPPPKVVLIANPGTAAQGCANNDGSAVDLVFQIEDEPPTASLKEGDGTKSKLTFGPPLVANQYLHIRVNVTLEEAMKLGHWTIGSPDAKGGLSAWICPAGGYPCDHATSRSVTFTRADDGSLEGRATLLFESGSKVEGDFLARIAPRTIGSPPVVCG
jgi:hypothetical protein